MRCDDPPQCAWGAVGTVTQVRTLIQDIKDVRQSKIQDGLKDLGGATTAVKVGRVTLYPLSQACVHAHACTCMWMCLHEHVRTHSQPGFCGESSTGGSRHSMPFPVYILSFRHALTLRSQRARQKDFLPCPVLHAHVHKYAKCLFLSFFAARQFVGDGSDPGAPLPVQGIGAPPEARQGHCCPVHCNWHRERVHAHSMSGKGRNLHHLRLFKYSLE